MKTQNVTLKLPYNIVEKARKRAEKERRSLSGYIAFLIAQDAATLGGPVLSVTAPDNIREYTPVEFEGEDPDLVEQRNQVMNGLLTTSGR